MKKEEDGSVIYVTKESDGVEGIVLIDVDGTRYVPAPELGEVAPEPDAPEQAEAEDGLDVVRVEATGHEPEKEDSLQQEEEMLHAETLAEQGGLEADERSDVRVDVAEGADAEETADEAVAEETDSLKDEEDDDPVDLGLPVDLTDEDDEEDV
ncbi:MAG: hypothetical protein H0U53_00660 [Actinobacteria bacterium]|nr:hypothetical protein [Actinomycetota bacterium]